MNYISAMRPAVVFAEEVPVKPTTLNTPKNHIAIHYIRVHNILRFTERFADL